MARDASEAEVQAAYRRRAKKTHPDAGGSPEAFARTSKALAILSNERARRHYDETGEVEEPDADNAQADAHSVLAMLIAEVTSLGDNTPPVASLAKAVRQQLKRVIDAMERQLKTARQTTVYVEQAAAFYAPTPLGPLLRRDAAFKHEQEARIKSRLETAWRALDILDGNPPP